MTAGKSDWWIEAELQNRFRLKCGMEFRILWSDDGMAGFLGWERKRVMNRGPGICSLKRDSSIINVRAKILRKYMKFQYIKDLGKKSKSVVDRENLLS